MVIEVELGPADRSRAADSKGSVAPISVVGTSSITHESRKRQRLNAKKPGWKCCQMMA